MIIIAGLPLFPIPYFNGKFYARSGTCLALHITPHKPEGWEYSVAIFLVSNLVAFLVIVGCYGYMYKTIRLSRRKMNKLKARQKRETQVTTTTQTNLTIGDNLLVSQIIGRSSDGCYSGDQLLVLVSRYRHGNDVFGRTHYSWFDSHQCIIS